MDARALLRAKKAGAAGPASSTGTNPYLKFDARGDQRCSICGVLAKHWDAHQVSKQHKTSLQRVRQEEAAVAAAAKKKEGKKRQAVDDIPMEGPTVEETKDVAQDEEIADRSTKRVRTKGDAEAGQGQQGGSTATVDAELDSFLSSLSSIPTPDPAPALAPAATTTSKSRYKPSQPETQTFYESAPIKNALPATTKGSSTISSSATAASNPFAGRLQERIAVGPEKPSDEAVEEEEEEEETPAQKRGREQREEREEIMSRLEEEQRAQEEADERVQSLKARMELIKKQRAAAKANKA
ncbi:hypothetical protein QFC22_005179 [Naganishia vaughanmartiniae]|uniref:Uncharacterized protein n=1 Tax=Naganishia vaughanmartiniae TaxID=1424756 RepID=A0ACC2WWL2_9TREE|nr:hypothetical protein QFC22_005179 [Naganishia vaughanmartiniae]